MTGAPGPMLTAESGGPYRDCDASEFSLMSDEELMSIPFDGYVDMDFGCSRDNNPTYPTTAASPVDFSTFPNLDWDLNLDLSGIFAARDEKDFQDAMANYSYARQKACQVSSAMVENGTLHTDYDGALSHFRVLAEIISTISHYPLPESYPTDGVSVSTSKGVWIVTSAEAESLLACGKPRRVMIIPASLDQYSLPRVSLEKALNKLRLLREPTNVKNGDFSHPTNGEAVDVNTLAERLGKSHQGLNILLRGAETSNKTPSWIVNLPGWDYLAVMTEDLALEKQNAYDERDASLSRIDDYYSSFGAWIPARIERGGFVITVRVQVGRKLWVYWPEHDVSQRFDESNRPNGMAQCVLLGPGDYLVHPAGVPYASVALGEEGTVTTVAAYAPTQDLERQLECLCAEHNFKSAYVGLDRNYKIEGKIGRAISLMQEGNKGWPWPPPERWSHIKATFEVRNRLISKR